MKKKIGMFMAAVVAALVVALPAHQATLTSGKKSEPTIIAKGGGTGGGDGDRLPGV